MAITNLVWAAVAGSILLAGCGGQNTTSGRGELLVSPPQRTLSLNAAEFTARLSSTPEGTSAWKLSTGSTAVPLPCGVDIHHILYRTVGGQGEPTTASGAVMVPNGSGVSCTGARPILLYAHGTTITQSYNLAGLGDPGNAAYPEALLLASLYAAQGYIVVAPNYAGYDRSTLSYHPYMHADQQSKDMMDALTAAKSALRMLQRPAVASNKLFVSGYSQGGYVALATARAMQSATPPMAITALAPMSGPYALSAYVDGVFLGQVPAGSTAFAPLLINSYKHSYPQRAIYGAITEVFESAYASGIESLAPGSYDFSSAVNNGKLPASYLFNSVLGVYGANAVFTAMSPPTGTGPTDALFAQGFGPSNLVQNSYRFGYVADALAHGDDVLASAPSTLQPPAAPGHVLRQLLVANDLRNVVPTSPTLLCGAAGDPTVFYAPNTQVLVGLWSARALANWSVLNLESAPPSTAVGAGGYQGLFAQAKSDFVAALPAGANANAELTKNYHGNLAVPICSRAAKDFFDRF